MIKQGKTAWEKQEDGIEYSSIPFSGARPIVIDKNGNWHSCNRKQCETHQKRKNSVKI